MGILDRFRGRPRFDGCDVVRGGLETLFSQLHRAYGDCERASPSEVEKSFVENAVDGVLEAAFASEWNSAHGESALEEWSDFRKQAARRLVEQNGPALLPCIHLAYAMGRWVGTYYSQLEQTVPAGRYAVREHGAAGYDLICQALHLDGMLARLCRESNGWLRLGGSVHQCEWLIGHSQRVLYSASMSTVYHTWYTGASEGARRAGRWLDYVPKAKDDRTRANLERHVAKVKSLCERDKAFIEGYYEVGDSLALLENMLD